MNKKVTFWLFTGSIISILLFIIGDDDNNLFKENADWFLFDSSLFITFLFLFFRYFKSKKIAFEKRDLLFFLPNIAYFIIEGLEVLYIEENIFIEIIEMLIEAILLGYLFYILISFFKQKSKFWILYFIVPIVLILSLSYVNEVLELMGIDALIISNDKNYSSYLLVVVAFLFYFISFYLIQKPKDLLPIERQKKYKTSNLNDNQINDYRLRIVEAMEVNKLYRDSNLSIHKLSENLNIPRQYISEVLNLHLHKSFFDFINEYRVNEFIENIQDEQNAHFTLISIANSVGFNSKSSFNATFKKFKGLTPTEFKKSLSNK